jgi:serine/threonine protein kinase
LKFLPCARGQGPVQELRSLQMIRQLHHPQLTRIDRVWCAPGCLVVAMELADGSLADLLDVYRADLGTALPADHLCPLLTQAAAALDFLNGRQHFLGEQWVTVQHCDVTPANLLLFGKAVKLTDFGLTTTLTTAQKGHHRAGTPDYAAPEVFQGRVSERTDQYALAVCYCVLRGGRLPFADTPPSFVPGYVRPAPDLSMLSPEEGQVVARALSPLPQDRWSSCGEMMARLEELARPEPDGERERVERRRAERYRPEAGLRCQVLPTLGNGAWSAAVQNISVGGIRLRVTQPDGPLRPGRVLQLALRNEGRGQRRVVEVRLTHSAEVEGGDYEVGGPFNRELSTEELQALSGGGT